MNTKFINYFYDHNPKIKIDDSFNSSIESDPLLSTSFQTPNFDFTKLNNKSTE